jgi:hypothetical protein
MFLDALRAALDVPTLSDPFIAQFDRALAARLASAPAGIHARHVETTAIFAAAFDTLTTAGTPDSIAVLGLVIDRYGAEITTHMRATLDAAADPFIAIVEESKSREESYFGADFAFERPRHDANAYHLHITACAYARLFAAWGVPQLTGLFCRLDEAWMRALDPPTDGVSFSRPMTIGWGGSRCLFLFDRTGHPHRR